MDKMKIKRETITSDNFIELAKKSHPNENLEYDLSYFINSHTKIPIIDHDINPKTGNEYGVYWQMPVAHIYGKQGHPLKKRQQKRGHRNVSKDDVDRRKKEFIDKAKLVHKGEDLDFSQINFINNNTPVYIIDHDINPDTGKEYGGYWQRPRNVISGQKHPLKNKSHKSDLKEFISKAKKVHKDENLDYSKVVYLGSKKEVCIIDHDINPKTGKEYGEYWQKPISHLSGHGHPDRSYLANFKDAKLVIEDMKKSIGGCSLDYSSFQYKGMDEEAIFICHKTDKNGIEHGAFLSKPRYVISAKQCVCPKCMRHGISIKEDNLYDFLCTFLNKSDIIRGSKKILNGLQLDFYLPKLKVAIEFNGLYWHSDSCIDPKDENYHFNKLKLCNEKGIYLIQIFEDEWDNHNDGVKFQIKFLLGLWGKMSQREMYACIIQKVKSIDNDIDIIDFIKNHSILGYKKEIEYYILLNEDKIIAFIGIRKMKNSIIHIVDFMSKYRNIEIYERLIDTIVSDYKSYNIFAKIDMRWYNGNFIRSFIKRIGLNKCKDIKPFPWIYSPRKGIKRYKALNDSIKDQYKVYDCGFEVYKFPILRASNQWACSHQS